MKKAILIIVVTVLMIASSLSDSLIEIEGCNHTDRCISHSEHHRKELTSAPIDY